VLLVMLSRMAGPFTFVPALACFMTASMMAYPSLGAHPGILIVTILAGFLVPIGLELVDVLTRTWELRDGMLVSHAGALELQGSSSVTMVVVGSVATIAVAGIHNAVTAKAYRSAQRQLVMQTWHLRQLLPAPG
jgi:predicted benzoate:H+ symporter BenE